MKLLTQELRAKLPKLYAQEHSPDPVVYVKFFLPFTHWHWYATEFDGEDTFFGWVYGDYPELGYFTLSELVLVSGAKWKRPVERAYRISLEYIVPQIVSILWMSTRWSGLWSGSISHRILVLVCGAKWLKPLEMAM